MKTRELISSILAFLALSMPSYTFFCPSAAQAAIRTIPGAASAYTTATAVVGSIQTLWRHYSFGFEYGSAYQSKLMQIAYFDYTVDKALICGEYVQFEFCRKSYLGALTCDVNVGVASDYALGGREHRMVLSNTSAPSSVWDYYFARFAWAQTPANCSTTLSVTPTGISVLTSD